MLCNLAQVSTKQLLAPLLLYLHMLLWHMLQDAPVGHCWSMPEGTSGAAYARFMGSRGIRADDRLMTGRPCALWMMRS